MNRDDNMRMQEDGNDVRDGQRRQARDNGNNVGGAQAIPDDEPALEGYARWVIYIYMYWWNWADPMGLYPK